MAIRRRSRETLILAFLGVCIVSGLFAMMRTSSPGPLRSSSRPMTEPGRVEVRSHGDPKTWVAAWQEAGSKIPSAPDDPVGTRPGPVPTEWGEGIAGKAGFSFPSSYGYEFLNIWWHDAGDVYLSVLAGSIVSTGEPAVLVIRVDPVTRKSKFQPLLQPALKGPVRIIDAEKMTLLLESVKNGERVSLDVGDMSFAPA